MDRQHWSRRIGQLDPARDYEQIYRILAFHEFPADAETLRRLRALTVRFMPPRKEPLYARQLPNIRSYPQGYDVARLGTFPPGCPVPHAELLPAAPTRAGAGMQRLSRRGGRARGTPGTTREDPAKGPHETALPPPRPSVFRHLSAPSPGPGPLTGRYPNIARRSEEG
jgi:hypothetical protein